MKGTTAMNINMTETDIARAITLLEDEAAIDLEKLQLGRWAIASERGLYGVYNTKNEAIDVALSNHCQLRKFSKVKRHRKGVYSLSRPGVKFCVSNIRQSQEWHWKAGRILA